jgi:putative flippase GtrA
MSQVAPAVPVPSTGSPASTPSAERPLVVGGRRPATVEIVVPVHNEQDDLEASIRRLHEFLGERFPLTWLVTIADNASTDGTWGIACRLAGELPGVRAIRLARKGRGRALRATWLASDATVVAYMDVDLSTDLAALLPLVAPLVSGHSDVAIGTRLAPGARVIRGPKRELISHIYNLLLRTTLRSGFSDAQCGFKAVRTDVARTLVPMVEDEAWFFDTELLVLAEHNGLRIHEVPVDWIDDPDSRVDIVRTARADLQGVWRMLGRLVRGRAAARDPLGDGQTGGAGPAGHPLSLRRRIEPDLVSQLARFASIGVVSTVVFGALFAVLSGPLGAVAAAFVAMAVCGVANTAANRRLTFALRGRAGLVRHHLAGLALSVLPLAATLATLGVLGLAGEGNRPVQLMAVTAANATATLGRFVLLRQWVFRPAGAPPFGRTLSWERVQQMARYAIVSAISTTISLTVLAVLVATSTVAAGWANVIATSAGIVPSFELNRRWVWSRRGRRSLVREVGPFCALSFAGLGLSTLAVAATAHWATNAGLGTGPRTLAVTSANLIAFGTLWVLQFVLLDKVLFRRAGGGSFGGWQTIP